MAARKRRPQSRLWLWRAPDRWNENKIVPSDIRAETAASEGQGWNLVLDLFTCGLVGVFLIAIIIRLVIAAQNRRARDIKASVIAPIFDSSAVESTLFGYEPGADRSLSAQSLSTQSRATTTSTETTSTSEAEPHTTADRQQPWPVCERKPEPRHPHQKLAIPTIRLIFALK